MPLKLKVQGEKAGDIAMKFVASLEKIYSETGQQRWLMRRTTNIVSY
jgi:hypothetical protein